MLRLGGSLAGGLNSFKENDRCEKPPKLPFPGSQTKPWPASVKPSKPQPLAPLTALARLFSRPVALAAEIDGPPKGTEIELKAGAEFQRIKAELRTIFE